MLHAYRQSGYNFLIKFLITPPSNGVETSHSTSFITGIMEERGMQINPEIRFPGRLFNLEKKLDCGNLAARLWYMGLNIIVWLPLAIATWIPLAILLTTKFIVSFTAFSLFCSSTTQEERDAVYIKNLEQRIVVEKETEKILARFIKEYVSWLLVLFWGPFIVFGFLVPCKILSIPKQNPILAPRGEPIELKAFRSCFGSFRW